MTATIAPAIPFLAAETTKSISLVYDFIPTRFPDAYLQSPAAKLANRVRVEALRHYDRLISISEATAADCRRILGEAVDVRVTGVADPLDGVAGRQPDTESGFMLMPIGGDPRKNPIAGLAALAKYRNTSGAALRAVVTGRLTGGQEAALRKAALELGLSEDALDLRGIVSADQLAGLYKAAELVFVGSFAEGFSIPVAEAVARGAPVVASDIASHRELIGPGPWLAGPADIEPLSDAIAYVSRNRAEVVEEQQKALGNKSDPTTVRDRVKDALDDLSVQASRRSAPATRNAARPRIAVVSPFPPQRSGVADYTAFTFGQASKYADVEVYSAARPASALPLPMHPLSGIPYLDRRFDAVINVVGNSHFHFPILDLLGSYGGACIAHDDRMVEAYRHDRGDDWAAELLSRPSHTVRPDEILNLIHDLDRLPSIGYDIVAQQASPLIVHGHALADTIFADTGTRPVVVPFVPYNIPPVPDIDDEVRTRARDALGLASDFLHIATFGIVDQRTKANDLIVASLAWLKAWDIPAQLHVVGQSSWFERRALRRLASDLEIEGDIVLHGHVPRVTLENFLFAVDVAVQLRTSSRLSLSGTLADCIAFGVPTVTSENIADELDAPSYVVTSPAITSSLLIAEAISSLRTRRRSDMAAIERERRDYLGRRSADGYVQAVLAALGLGSD
jgi:glycosyltransferase involved in cell wall biosynthesis